MGTKINSRLTARLVVSAVTLAFIAVALSASAPNARASSVFSWTTETPMGAMVSQAVVVGAANGTVYVMGGVLTTGYTAVANAYAYDPDAGDWTVLTSMPYAERGAAGAIGLDGKVYVFGGASGSSYTQIYDPVTNAWSLGASMLDGAWEAKAATVTNGSIWVVGGEGVPAGYVQIYDSVADSWSVGRPAPAAVECGAMVAVGNDLYYSGGGVASYTGTTNFFMYDSTAGNWIDTLQAMPVARAAHAMVVGVDGLIYVVGGSSDAFNTGADAYSSTVVYDPVANEWSTAADMSYARKYLGATVTPDGRIMAVGGNTPSSVLNAVESLQLYTFSYSITLSASSVRAGETVLMTVDAQFTYIDEQYSQLDWYILSDADGTIYNPDSLQIPTNATAAISVEVPVLAPAGSYHVVVNSWIIFAEGVYEIVKDQKFALEVLPAPAPVDVLIADLEAQIADLQTALNSQDANVTALTADVAGLQAQLTALQSNVNADNASQSAALADLQEQITALQNQLDKVKTTSDSGNMWGMVNMVLVIIVIVLLALMFVMSRRGKSPAPPTP